MRHRSPRRMLFEPLACHFGDASGGLELLSAGGLRRSWQAGMSRDCGCAKALQLRRDFVL